MGHDGFDHRAARLGMVVDADPIGGVECAVLPEDLGWDRQLPQTVQERPVLQCRNLCSVESRFFRQYDGEARGALAVTPCVGVVELSGLD